MAQKLNFDTRNFTPPTSLKEAMQRSALELECLLVWMRNEARYHDNLDQKILDAACFAVNMIEDKLSEMRALMPDIERRATGADLV